MNKFIMTFKTFEMNRFISFECIISMRLMHPPQNIPYPHDDLKLSHLVEN